MSALLGTVHRLLKTPRVDASGGVRGLSDPRWAVVALAYAGAALLMAQDPWYGTDLFAWTQGILVLLLTLVLVATAVFDWQLLGPTRGINLVLHALLCCPVALLLGRLLAQPGAPVPSEPAAWFPGIAEALSQALSGAATVLPPFVVNLFNLLREIFTSLGLVLFILVAAIALEVRGLGWRLGLLGVALMVPASAALAWSPHPSLAFLGGTILLAFGIAIQAADMSRIAVEQAILRRLADVHDVAERRAALGLALWAVRHGPVSETQVALHVQQAWLASNLDAESRRQIAYGLTLRLVRVWEVLELVGTPKGMHLVISPRLLRQSHPLAPLAIVPRRLVLGIVALLYVLSPIDLIPDAIPIVGNLDDLALALATAWPWLRAWTSRGRSSAIEVDGRE